MKRERPTAVLVMAILNIVFGSLALLMGVCGGIGILFLTTVNLPAPQAGQPDILAISKAPYTVPGFKEFELARAGVGTLTSILMLSAGIGLLKMRRWGRTASIVFAAVSILGNLIATPIQIVQFNPLVSEAVSKATPPGQPSFMSGPLFANVTAIFGLCIALIYSLTLLIIMFRPNVRAAFNAPEPGPEDQADEDDTQRNDLDDERS